MKKIINKNTSNGYCGLNNGLINVVNIPNLPESLITNLTLDLPNKADIVSRYWKSSEIPLSVPLIINSVTNLTNDLNNKADLVSGYLKSSEIPLTNPLLLIHYQHQIIY